MIKLSTKNEPSIGSYASHADLHPARRLIVLVPGPEADLTSVTRRIWELANSTKASVTFLGLCGDASQEPSLRRILVTQSALMNSGGVFAEAEIIVGKDWGNAVAARVQAGDMLLCWHEATGLLHKKVSTILEMNPHLPAYIVSEPRSRNTTQRRWLPAAAAWIGSIAIIVAFFWFQVEVDHIAKSMSVGLQVASVALEFWLLMAWNKLLS